MKSKTDLAVEGATKRFGGLAAVDDVSFRVESGKFFSILGPSGCGKTTLLRMIAGFESPDEGTIEIRGQDMAGIPPNRRPVNLIFQHLALFPMMNVEGNIAFGLKRRGLGKKEIRRKIGEILERVDLAGFGPKRIHQLSGGQKQRVAIARCLVLEPAVLLLDEPLGALDLKLREQMKVELKKLQAKVGTTFVYITHDQSEALVMSDHIAVMNRGRFEQTDTPENLYHAPKTPFVAGFVGDNNAWPCEAAGRDGDDAVLATPEGIRFRVPSRENFSFGGPVQLFLRPEAMILQPGPDEERINRFDASVKAFLFDGAASRVLVVPKGSDRDLLVALPQNRRYDHIEPGSEIQVGWHPEVAVCFPKDPKDPEEPGEDREEQ